QLRPVVDDDLQNLRARVAAARALAEQHSTNSIGDAEQSELSAITAFAADIDHVERNIKQLDVLYRNNAPVTEQRALKDELRNHLTGATAVNLQKHAEAKMAESVAAVERTIRMTDLSELIAVCLSIVAGTLLAVIVGRSISKPLAVLRDAAIRIGDGDMDTR